jgi:hypothetical protein
MHPAIWIVDSLTNDPPAPSVHPLGSAPKLVKETYHATPEQLDCIVRSIFPEPPADGGYPKLNWNYFIILDQIALIVHSPLSLLNSKDNLYF